jgi:hypothetical protein
MGLWTGERVPVFRPWWTGYIPLRRLLILATHFRFDGPERRGGEAVAAKGGAARVSSDMVADWLSEWPFDASKLTARSRGGRGDDDEAGGVVGEAQES